MAKQPEREKSYWSPNMKPTEIIVNCYGMNTLKEAGEEIFPRAWFSDGKLNTGRGSVRKTKM